MKRVRNMLWKLNPGHRPRVELLRIEDKNMARMRPWFINETHQITIVLC